MKLLRCYKILTLILVSVTLLFIAGCKSKKTIATSGTLEKKTQNQIITDVLNEEYKFETMTTKGSIEVKSGSSSQKIPAVFKIIKDSVLQASIRIPILGGEAMRVTFTPDSIIIVDRLKKKYVAEDFKSSKAIADFDFNFYNLQALLTNKLFIPGNQNIEKKDFDEYKISEANNLYLLQTQGKGNLSYNFAIDASNRLASTLVHNKEKNITLQWSYDDFIDDNNQIYPTNMSAKVGIDKIRFDVNISYDKLDINKTFNVDNSISPKYTKVSITEILSSYMKIK